MRRPGQAKMAARMVADFTKLAQESPLVAGVAAGAVSAVISGVPSLTWFFSTAPSVDFWLSDYVWPSLAAAGNILLPHSFSENALIVAGVVAHCCLAVGWSVLLSLATSNIKDPMLVFIACVLAAMCIHVFDLLIVPIFWNMPLIANLVRKTGYLPHFFDHISFGASAGLTLALIKWSEPHASRRMRID